MFPCKPVDLSCGGRICFCVCIRQKTCTDSGAGWLVNHYPLTSIPASMDSSDAPASFFVASAFLSTSAAALDFSFSHSATTCLTEGNTPPAPRAQTLMVCFVRSWYGTHKIYHVYKAVERCYRLKKAQERSSDI